jgi:hypothetical protein
MQGFSQLGLNEKLKPSTAWEKGYLVFKGQKDTIKGFTSIQTTEFGYLHSIWFCTDTMNNKNSFSISTEKVDMDTVRFLGFEKRNFKYFNYTDKTVPKSIRGNVFLVGWVEIIEKGAINISLGFSTREYLSPTFKINNPQNPMVKTFTPMYCLKKGSLPTILIATSTITDFNTAFTSYKVNDEYKQHFISYLSDDTELVEKIRTKELLFSDIEVYVKEYNKRVKAKQN